MIDLLTDIWPILLILGVIGGSFLIPDQKPTPTNIVDKFIDHKFKTPNTKK
jgi:hypothetical protein